MYNELFGEDRESSKAQSDWIGDEEITCIGNCEVDIAFSACRFV